MLEIPIYITNDFSIFFIGWDLIKMVYSVITLFSCCQILRIGKQTNRRIWSIGYLVINSTSNHEMLYSRYSHKCWEHLYHLYSVIYKYISNCSLKLGHLFMSKMIISPLLNIPLKNKYSYIFFHWAKNIIYTYNILFSPLTIDIIRKAPVCVKLLVQKSFPQITFNVMVCNHKAMFLIFFSLGTFEVCI